MTQRQGGNVVKTAIQVLALYGACVAMLIALALGIGLALNWLIPRIEFGTATLIGLISLLGSLTILVIIITSPNVSAIADVVDEQESDVPDEEYLEQIVERVMDRLPTSSARRKRR
jgi:hypothetical protein